jgi:hypothetical protein
MAEIRTARPPRRGPAGARNWVLLVLDSCRYDSVVAAAPQHLAALGPLQRRWSYASWTGPAHYNLLTGLMPHPSPPGRHAAEVYHDELAAFRDRLGVSLDWSALAPSLWLPTLLSARGWVCQAWTSLPVLHPSTPLSAGFHRFRLRDAHADLAGIIDELRFYDDAPAFWMINAGETHYPYEVPGRTYDPLPRISGLHGAVRRFDDHGVSPPRFAAAQLAALQQRQVDAVRYVDGLIPRLRALVPDGTWLTVTADHGECFGEDGYFGHGPIVHPKVLEVPLIEGLLR